MSSEWDQPAPLSRGSSPARAAAFEAEAGLIDPAALFGFVFRNVFRIAAIAILLTAAGIVLVGLMPFPYRATATVLVDPRDPQITLQEDVLRPIGSDAAILESMVQIMKSDGFLLSVMSQLEMIDRGSPELGEEQLRALAKFKKNLAVERKGATYLVEVTYKAETAEEAARIANSVAESFAATQNGYLSQATESAARALSERLVDLRRKVNASEKAVSDFAAEHGILYVDNDNTLEMRQLTELSAQLAVARNATEQARARYQRQIQDGDQVLLPNERETEPAQLAFLRQQRAQLMQSLDQQSLTYGSRHPRIAQTRQAIEGMERQIAEEKQSLVEQLKGALDVTEAQQRKLEADVARLSSGATVTEAAEVRLQALRREAAADREIYEAFLSRNKATDELAVLKSDTVRVVSPAVPPLRSSRPSIILLAPVLGLLSAVAGTVVVATGSRTAARGSAGPVERAADRPAPAREAGPEMPAGEPLRPSAPRKNTSLLMLAEPASVAPALRHRALS